jgi:hypothetical protein
VVQSEINSPSTVPSSIQHSSSPHTLNPPPTTRISTQPLKQQQQQPLPSPATPAAIPPSQLHPPTEPPEEALKRTGFCTNYGAVGASRMSVY